MSRLTAFRESTPVRFGVSVASVAIAAALRIVLAPVFGDRNELLFFYPAIMITAWFGGLWPGLASTIVAALFAAYLFLEPRGTVLVAHRGDALALMLFVAIGIVITVLNENLRRGVLRQREARDAAEQARAEAAAANRTKDFFLAAVSHDLRTPTTAIMGWAQMLERGVLEPSQQRRAAESIRRNAARQITLIEDLLDTAAILAGGLRLQPAVVDLGSIVHAAVDVLQPTASGKNICLRVDCPRDVVSVNGDGLRLQQVVWNLVSNAIKFTPDGGAVEVAIGIDGDEARIDVRDTGPGIQADAVPFVFDRFWQGKRRGTGRGVGLGLGIAKHLVEAHRGAIRVVSAGDGQGTTFTVRLPRTVGAPASV